MSGALGRPTQKQGCLCAQDKKFSKQKIGIRSRERRKKGHISEESLSFPTTLRRSHQKNEREREGAKNRKRIRRQERKGRRRSSDQDAEEASSSSSFFSLLNRFHVCNPRSVRKNGLLGSCTSCSTHCFLFWHCQCLRRCPCRQGSTISLSASLSVYHSLSVSPSLSPSP